ncbi:flagellar protein FlhE [Halomonas salifodinae]|uniref:flagellar protein FlhE n=1 Tax=Halomonas salifodinae TaxID=438745 RepID=UPI0033ADCDC7
MRRWPAALFLLLLAGQAVAAGSWIAEPPPLRLSVVGRDTVSAPIQAPPGVASGAEITRVRWRLESPVGAFPPLRLCQAERCMPLTGPRGISEGLAGAPADRPLRLHGRLPEGQRGALSLGGIQLIIDYR